jgi:predicted chitinase
MILNLATLKKAFAHANADYLGAILDNAGFLAEHGILANERRLRHFLAQGAAETSGFTLRVESGNYTAEGLLKTFPKYFKSKAIARAYAGRPQAIFNKTYGGRLGNTAPGDGYKYRGRGIFQITGKDAYKHYGSLLGLDLVGNPDLAADPMTSVKIAVLYWRDLGLNEWADKDDLLAVSRGINGGNPKRNIQPNGMEHRKTWLTKLKKVDFLGMAPEPAADTPEGAIEEGDAGEEIARLQSLLRAKGYATGAIDGIYGANTKRAVQAFQLDHMKPDGPPSGIWLRDYWPALEAVPNIQIERAQATATDLHKQADPIVRQATFAERILTWLGLGALVTGGASSTAGNFPELVTQYRPVIEIVQPAFQWAANNGWLLVALGAFAGWLILRSLIKALVKAYRHGDYQGPYKEVK